MEIPLWFFLGAVKLLVITLNRSVGPRDRQQSVVAAAKPRSTGGWARQQQQLRWLLSERALSLSGFWVLSTGP